MQNFQDDRLGYVRARSLFTQDDFYDNFIYDVNRARVCVEILLPMSPIDMQGFCKLLWNE